MIGGIEGGTVGNLNIVVDAIETVGAIGFAVAVGGGGGIVEDGVVVINAGIVVVSIEGIVSHEPLG